MDPVSNESVLHLEPCPFCGGEVRIIVPHVADMSRYISHVDGHCPLEFSEFHCDGDLETDWNRRTPPSGDREAVLEALRELVRLKGGRDALDAIDAKGWSREQSRLLSKSTREMSAAWEAARTALKHKDAKS